MDYLWRVLKSWLPLATAATILCGLIYVSVQQSFRMAANDPQIRMAEDAARGLAAGQNAAELLTAGQVDLQYSLAPFLIIFDAAGRVVAANATLHNQVPVPPKGVLAYARTNGEDRVTWQPEPGVRSATVIVPIDGGVGGYVLAGRSLREVEARVGQLNLLVGAGWLAAVLATLFLVLLLEGMSTRRVHTTAG
ncbi:MAG: hypothetical protein ACK2UW_06195 [Anaerolineales bacterium]